jgi:holo-[acyl-carrier protein] synthase
LNIHLDTGIVHIPPTQVASLRFGDKFLRRVHTPIEQQNIANLQLNAKDLSSQGFAALTGQRVVEAVVEALRTEWQDVRYLNLEIYSQTTGSPQVCLYGASPEIVGFHYK